MRILKVVLLFLIFVSVSHSAFAQMEVVADTTLRFDTLDYKGQKIVLFSNNTWDYVIPEQILARDKMMLDTMSIFREYWNNDITFAYMYPADKPLADSIPIALTADGRKFSIPVLGGITSGFGWRGRREHKAIDIGLEKGTPIKAAFDGKVRYAKYNTGGYGNLIIIRHFNGLETYYGHLSRIYVKPNQVVRSGQVIGAGGNTGAPWAGPHLHFETRYRDHAFDPLLLINWDSLALRDDSVTLKAYHFRIKQNHKAYVSGGVNDYEGKPQYQQVASTQNTQMKRTGGPVTTYNAANRPGVHVVRKGDTLSKIASTYGTTIDRLCKLNGISKTTTLQIGQKIRLK